MAKWKIWAGLLVLFVSGVLIGSVGTRIYVRHKISGMIARERPFIRNLFLHRLTRELDLTKEQRQEIEQIANRTAEQFHELQRQHRAQVEDILDQAVTDMKEDLSPEQQKQVDEIRNQMKVWHKMRLWHKRNKRKMHGPPPPGMLEHRPPPPPPPPPAPPSPR